MNADAYADMKVRREEIARAALERQARMDQAAASLREAREAEQGRPADEEAEARHQMHEEQAGDLAD